MTKHTVVTTVQMTHIIECPEEEIHKVLTDMLLSEKHIVAFVRNDFDADDVLITGRKIFTMDEG